MNTKINAGVFDNFPLLESKRLLFREFHDTDARDLFKIRSNEKVMNFMDTERHLNIEYSKKLIATIHNSFEDKSGINWAIIEKSSNKFIGYFGFWRLIYEHCRAEIGYALKPKFWGKGFMAESIGTFINFAFTDFKLHSLEANVNPKNIASIKLLENLNFQKEAYFRENYLFDGRYIDSLIYSIIESDVK